MLRGVSGFFCNALQIQRWQKAHVCFHYFTKSMFYCYYEFTGIKSVSN